MPYYVSEDDAKILRQIAKQVLGAPTGGDAPNSVDSPDMYLTPEIYIAELPEGGIPPMTRVGNDFIPGSASCYICRIAYDQTSTQYIVERQYFKHTVYNLSLCHIGSDLYGTDTGTGTGTSLGVYSTGRFRIVQRDKYGAWVIEQRLTKRFAMTPTGGIPRATMNLAGDQITPGSETCELWSWDPIVGAYTKLLDGVGAQVALTIRNPWPTAINGDRLITFSEDDDGLLTVDAEACEAF